MRVWLATMLLLFSWYGWFDCSLKPRFGTTFLIALVLFITFANIAFTTFGVISQAVVGVLTAFITAFLTTGLALDVAFLTAGFFTNLTVTVLRAVRRRVSILVADSAGLIQERWADNFTIGSWLVLDEVAGVFFFGFSGITAHLAEWRGGGGGGALAVAVVSSGRHFDELILIETVVRVV